MPGDRPRPIVARRRIGAPADQVVRFLGDLENHARLAPGAVELLSLERSPGRGAHALVRLRGPLGMQCTARTELVQSPAANSIAGRARVGNGTLVSIAWRIDPRGGRSIVTLSATLDATRPLDALLLRLGGRRWLATRFAEALDHLSDELAAVPVSVQARLPGASGVGTVGMGRHELAAGSDIELGEHLP
jgi:carbon monoxide dehydrogenase subunit G